MFPCSSQSASEIKAINAYYEETRNLAKNVARTHVNAIKLAFALDILPNERIDRILVEEIQQVIKEIFPKVVQTNS